MNTYKLFRTLILFTVLTAVGTVKSVADNLHVATTGNDNNAGTQEAPLLTIHKAVELVQPGDTIWVHAGRYVISERIKIPAKATSAERRCYLWGVPGEGEVVIDGSAMNHTAMNDFKMGRCIYVNHLANYWHFKGLTLCNAEDNGMKVEGSYNIIEQCVFHDNNDTGLQIGMYKDFSIEETKSLPAGSPQFNPGYQFCRGNKVINCDSYNNYDARTYNGSDDGGDADGFACKLFPGPGTEFRGCRAWNNSDDNWDLYMVYHPVRIDSCWAYHAGYTPDGEAVGNGNGFKLGGGGSSGGAAFDQSLGAHVLTNCVSFDNLKKGYDQNNAYEGMYVINCTAWGNDFNYRFPTLFKYGGMTIRNCIGWGALTFNHEFLSEDKEGSIVPDTDFNSWTTLDGCNPYKEGQKVGKDKPMTGDYSSEFVSLSVADFMAPREADGSLPRNGFARLKEGSVMKDKGMPIVGFTPARHLPADEAAKAGLELIAIDDLYMPYNDAAPDFGAFELSGIPADVQEPEKVTLECLTGNSMQEIVEGEAIADIVYRTGGPVTGCVVEGLSEGLSYHVEDSLINISGTPATSCTYCVTVVGGAKPVSTTGTITCVVPFTVLTGDWYHFQDDISALPAELQGVVDVVTSDPDYPSRIVPDYTESNGVVPGGCTQGALVMGRNKGGARWTFDDRGVLQLLANLHFTGKRAFIIEYVLADGQRLSVSVPETAKGTYCNWDVLQQAGLEGQGRQVRSISLLNNNSKGEVRMYDMYVRVPQHQQSTGISSVTLPSSLPSSAASRKLFEAGRIVIERNGKRYNTCGQAVKARTL
jgi:hypothetical protein